MGLQNTLKKKLLTTYRISLRRFFSQASPGVIFYIPVKQAPKVVPGKVRRIQKSPGNRKLPRVFLVTRWRFELQTHCLKGNCSAN